jgi:hypothetical protein
VTECANSFFVLQRRKGHGTRGLASLFVGTLDSIFDTRPPPYRILLQTDQSDISYREELFIYLQIVPITEIAIALQRKDIAENWQWLEKNLLPSMGGFLFCANTKPVCSQLRRAVDVRHASIRVFKNRQPSQRTADDFNNRPAIR